MTQQMFDEFMIEMRLQTVLMERILEATQETKLIVNTLDLHKVPMITTPDTQPSVPSMPPAPKKGGRR